MNVGRYKAYSSLLPSPMRKMAMEYQPELGTAFVLWLPPQGLFGAHLFFLRRPEAWVYLFTAGGCGIAWLLDLFRLKRLVTQARTAWFERRLSRTIEQSIDQYGSTGDGEGRTNTRAIVLPPTCVVCMESRIDSVFLDCGHAATCMSCAKQVLQNNERSCPLCRETCRELKRVYICSAADSF
jgi:hypothetical protein